MKTRHIIAIGLLSALAVGLLAIGIKSGNKPKVQTSATNEITDLTNTKWYFNETITTDQSANYSINFMSDYTSYTSIDIYVSNYITITFSPGGTIYDSRTNGWYYDDPRLIEIIDGTDTQNTNLINFLINNAIQIPNTDWMDGYQQGYTEGETAGYQTGYNEGHAAGYQTGYTEGKSDGYVEGNTAGQSTGYQSGYTTGYTAGETAGYETGYTAGETAGYETGYQTGLTASTTQAYQEGYTNGYGTGWNDADAFDHPIEIAPLMLNILTMPFTFISQAFDVTLWPGTEYQINIGNFIKAMLAISAILFIIKLFTSGFSIIGNYTSNKTNRDLKVSQTNLNRAKTKQIQDNSNKK